MGKSSSASTPNKERLKLWAMDLRITESRQGNSVLHYIGADRSEQYCCLGRACVVAIVNGCEVNVHIPPYGPVTYDGRSGVLPPSVVDWYGIEQSPGLQGKAAAFWNDNQILSFQQIADLIDKEFGL